MNIQWYSWNDFSQNNQPDSFFQTRLRVGNNGQGVENFGKVGHIVEFVGHEQVFVFEIQRQLAGSQKMADDFLALELKNETF